nr:sugar nucleotide-binding protein [Chthonobacter rhizosphaerae]
MTRRNGHYEPGAFDVRHDPPRPTAIARHVRRLTGREREDHATLTGEGWWRRASRFYAHVRPDGTPAPRAAETRRLLLVGSGRSAVGRGIAEICEIRGLDHAWSVGRDDLAGEIEAGRAWAVVDIRPPLAARQGVSGERLADLCRTRRIPYLLFSSEKVFDGSLGRPYVESDPVAPGCETGHQLADLERRALSAHPEGLVVRTGPVLTDAGTTAPGHLDGAPVLDAALHGASAPALIPLTTGCFSYLPDLVHAALDLLVDGADGLWHLVNDDEDDWDDVVRRTMGRVGVTLDDDGASRLADGRVVLRSERARVMPARESALGRYLAKHRLVL